VRYSAAWTIRLRTCVHRVNLGQKPIRSAHAPRPFIIALVPLCLLISFGCTATKYATLRETPKNPLSSQLNLFAKGGPQPTERTMQLLRRCDLVKELEGDPTVLQEKLHKWLLQDPNSEHYYAVAELAYIGGLKKQEADPKAALDLYGSAVMHAYLYLFDPQLDSTRNPYDPQYRGASDIYNEALEAALRIERSQGVLRPGMTHTISTATRQIDVTCEIKHSRWHNEDFEKFEFVSDYEVEGLANNYRTHGLGVPLVAVRHKHEDEDPAEKYYPPKLSIPVTAFLRIVGQKPATRPGDLPRVQAVLELCDPLATSDIEVAGRLVPLESNLTTPLAYFLSQPELDAKTLSTFGFLEPEKAQSLGGIYMLQPYEPGKIPVIMVHGLWSTPFTWMEMFNDLRSDPQLRDHYQFWFYMYPTGPPFWFSAAQMRTDLANLRKNLDPQRQEAALDNMVLVGHSMGGLISKLQAVESGDEFWKIASDHSIDEMKADPELREKIASTLYFHPNPSVRRVITIGTPHRGSSIANSTTSYLGAKLITEPMQLMAGRSQLIKDNPNYFHEDCLLEIQTSIDSLEPSSPFLQVLYETPPPAEVKIHTIIGEVPPDSFLRRIAGTSDGVVHVSSAKLPGATSELIVPADHSHVHAHPRSVLEVRRILLEHLAAIEADPKRNTVQFAKQASPLAPLQTAEVPHNAASHRPLPGFTSDSNLPRFASPSHQPPYAQSQNGHQQAPSGFVKDLPANPNPSYRPLPETFPTSAASDLQTALPSNADHNSNSLQQDMNGPVTVVPQPPEPKSNPVAPGTTNHSSSPRNPSQGTGTVRFSTAE
jgi:pimeloyl-ACP methyl ester carboxylesterase